MAMEIQAWFQSWLEQGAPARAVQDRGKKRPSSEAGVEKVDREQRQRLFTECRTQASQKLGEALTSAAKERQEEKGGLLNEIKKKMAYSFFQSCTPEQQDAICPLAQTLRSGNLDSLSAKFLSECALQGGAASGTSAVSEPVRTPEPSHCSQPAQAARPLPPSTTSGVSEPASASAPSQPSHGLQRGAETEDSTQPLTSTEAEPAAASPQNAPGMFAHHRDRRREINRVSKAIAGSNAAACHHFVGCRYSHAVSAETIEPRSGRHGGAIESCVRDMQQAWERHRIIPNYTRAGAGRRTPIG